MSKITKELLKSLFPKTKASLRDRFIKPMNTILPKYDITTKKRFAAFIANVGIESDRLKALEEYASGAAYEGREDLGNVRTGDGVRYKGRSVLQTTGRYNYWRVVVAYLRVLTGKNWDSKLAKSGPKGWDKYLKSEEYDALLKEADNYNVNFLANPELLENFPHAVEAAGVFVKDNNLNKYADAEQFSAYAGVLNRGDAKKKAMHYTDRLSLYKLAMEVIPDDFDLNAAETTPVNDKAVEVVTEIATTETPEAGEVEKTETTINEQDVTEKAYVTEPPSQGLGGKLKAGMGALFGGTVVYNVAERFFAFDFSTQGIIIICFVIFLAFLSFVVWAALDAWKQAQRTRVEAEAKTDIYKKDIVWVKPE